MRRFAIAFSASIVVMTQFAQAAPRCDGDFQFVRGAWVSTPYCRAVEIASVAREAGVHVSAEAILRNPAKADEVCRFIGSNIRAQPACEMVHRGPELAF